MNIFEKSTALQHAVELTKLNLQSTAEFVDAREVLIFMREIYDGLLADNAAKNTGKSN